MKTKIGKRLEKITTVILAIAMLLSCFTVYIGAEELTSGSCGENVNWSFDAETGELRITVRFLLLRLLSQ